MDETSGVDEDERARQAEETLTVWLREHDGEIVTIECGEEPERATVGPVCDEQGPLLKVGGRFANRRPVVGAEPLPGDAIRLWFADGSTTTLWPN